MVIYLNGARRGPFREEQVCNYLAEGLLQPTDLASDSAEGNLEPLATLLTRKEVVAPTPAPTAQLPPPALNETPGYRTSLHWIVFVRFALLGLVVFLLIAMPFAIAVQAVTGSQLGWFVLPLPAFIMVAPALAYKSSEMVVTNLRVVIKTGTLRRQSLEMFISKIESIAIDQSFLGRILDYGTVVVRGTGGLAERFDSIAHPLQFRAAVQRLKEKEAAGPVSEPGRLT